MQTSKIPFPAEYRAAGIVLHVTSLPSQFGIGDYGPMAETWIDCLADAGQTWWQILPLNPTEEGNSPYQPVSTFACNSLLISPQRLIEDGLLTSADCAGPIFPVDKVDYESVLPFKERLLQTAWENFQTTGHADLKAEFDRFRQEEAAWLDDFSVFMALKVRYDGAPYTEWPTELVHREPAALKQATGELSQLIEQYQFEQFLGFRQWRRIRQYAQDKGITILGDLPFYASPDSADVWGHPDQFAINADHEPLFVAGVPPDYFSAIGQLWGNPVYNWTTLRDTGYRWWIDRLRALFGHVDSVRLDHFRAFVAAWYVPAGAETAQTGEWIAGPGADFFENVRNGLGALPFVAEDLGLITDDVHELREQFHLPGMRVLQFAFDSDWNNPFLPHAYVENTVAYTGTHDNDTSRGWLTGLPEDRRRFVEEYLQQPGLSNDDIAWKLIEQAWHSKAALAITPFQDVLNLGSEARMNIPGTPVGNWSWRCSAEMLRDPAFPRLRALTEAAGRAPHR